jgi:hypothetical protein
MAVILLRPAGSAARTERVSVGPAGVQGDRVESRARAQRQMGRFVAFDSAASDLVAGDTNDAFDVFVHDRLR